MFCTLFFSLITVNSFLMDTSIRRGLNRGMQIRRSLMIYYPNVRLKFCPNPKSRQKYINYKQSPKSRPKKLMNPLSTAIIAGFGNLLQSHFESEVWAKLFSKSADPFTSHPPQ